MTQLELLIELRSRFEGIAARSNEDDIKTAAREAAELINQELLAYKTTNKLADIGPTVTIYGAGGGAPGSGDRGEFAIADIRLINGPAIKGEKEGE